MDKRVLDNFKMALPKIRVNLEQKTFSIDNKDIKLEDNFIGAQLSKTEEKPKETELELIYLLKKDFDPVNEAEKIYLLAQNKGYEQIEVNSFAMQEHAKEASFSAVVVYGEMDATLSNR